MAVLIGSVGAAAARGVPSHVRGGGPEAGGGEPVGRLTATAHDDIGVIVTGDAVDAPATMKTYSGDAYWITKAELAELRSSKGTAGPFTGLWFTEKYSYCENHGTPVYGYCTAAGVSFDRLFADAGLDAAEIAALDLVTVGAHDGSFSAGFVPSEARYVFVTPDATTGTIVAPMLALYEDDKDSFAELPAEATTVVEGDYTRLLLGQATPSESNRCVEVQDASQISLPAASPAFLIDAPDASSADASARQKNPYTLARLVADGNVTRTYVVGGRTFVCHGIDLKTLLDGARGTISSADRLVFTTSSGTVDFDLHVADVTFGAYLLAYYSEDASGTKPANATQVMLYGDGVAVGNVVSATVVAADTTKTAKLTLTSPTASQSRATMAKGTKLALRATATKAEGAASAEPITWKSSAANVAAVAVNGTVTARRTGNAVITASSGSLSARFRVKVVASRRNATRVGLPKSRAVTVGARLRLPVSVSPAGATSTISWRSSATKVATVDRGGWIVAQAKGAAVVTVTTSNGKKAACRLTVRAASSTRDRSGARHSGVSTADSMRPAVPATRAAVARDSDVTATSASLPGAVWKIRLSSALEGRRRRCRELDQAAFAALKARHRATYLDETEGTLYSGVALRRLVGLIDDGRPGSFDQRLATTAPGYLVRLVALDGYAVTLPSAAVATDDYLVADGLAVRGGAATALPLGSMTYYALARTVGYTPWWPLRISGAAVATQRWLRIGGINRIELLPAVDRSIGSSGRESL